MDFSIEACSGRTGWDIEPSGKVELDLDVLKDLFEEISVDSKHVVIGKINGAEVSVYPDGSMFIKKVGKKEDVKEIVRKIALFIE